MAITSDIRKPYSGNTRSLVLAFDVGTTFSGVSYAILEPNEIPKIHGVTRFPGQEHVAGSYKIPTLMFYDQDGIMKMAGAEADSSAILDLAEDEGWTKAELFKLRLRPQTMKLKMNGMRLPPLPKGKSAVQVFGEYLGYLFKCTKNFIIDTHAGGSALWRALEDDLQFVLSHPNGWEGAQQTKMRRAAVYGGLIPDTDAGKARIRFVTEGEASLHACVLNGLATETLTGHPGHGFLVADAGGGTLDISSYAVRGSSPLVMEEIAPPDCVFAGSVFVSRRARAFLEDKLRGSKYGTPDSLEHITKRFDETTKRLFRDKKEPQYVQFGSPLDKDLSVGIRQGQLKLTGAEVAELFEPSIEAAMTSISYQVETTGGFVKSVWLVGGFAASPWLFGQLQERLEPLGVTVSRPDNQTSKAVADGAIGFYCDHHVSARMSRFMYGVEFLREFNPEDPDHLARKDRICELPSGPKLLADAFDCILSRGVKVKESSVFTRKYCTEVTSLSTLSVFEVEIWCYRGGTTIPMWINRNAEDFTTLCIVQADLSPLASSAQPKPGRNGKTYWTIVFSVEIHFGLTEFKARIKWVDGGRTRYGPATIIYNEGGQRAEEDDLDDEDPVHPSFVSRGPSPPPPVADSQLPVPDRSYLEVPNAATSIHTSKSSGSSPEHSGVDKGKKREDASGGNSRPTSMSRNMPGGIELPGPIALTDSNSSRRSGSGRLSEALASVWGNIPPSAGPSANSSVLPSPLEGPTSRSALLNALQPLASVPEGSTIPEVVHADPSMEAGGVPEVYRSEPPKTPKAETPRASASPSRIPAAASSTARSPKATGTPKAVSRIPTAAPSARPGGTPRGLSIYSNGSQPPAVATPRGLSAASPTHVSPPADAPPEPPVAVTEPGEVQTEQPAAATPKPASRVPTKPPTRVASPSPQPAEAAAPSVAPEPPVVEAEPPAPVAEVEAPAAAAAPAPEQSPDPPAAEPAPAEPAAEPAPAEPAAAEEDGFTWGQPKSKGASRKTSRAGSKAGSKVASKAASKAASKVPSPKGTQTPNPEGGSAGASGEASAADGMQPPPEVQPPLTSVPEDAVTEAPAAETAPANEGELEGSSHAPGGFVMVGGNDPQAAPAPAPAEQLPSFPSFGSALTGSVGGMIGAASSAFSLFGRTEDKSKSPTPRASTPGWGGFGSAVPSAAGSTGALGWGSATGNNSPSHPTWQDGLGNNPGNASTTDLLGGDVTAGLSTGGGESHSQPTADEAAPTESPEQAGAPSREHLTVQTNVAAGATDAVTAGPTATGESPEGEGAEGGGGDEDGAAKAEDEEWGWPSMTVKQAKKKKGNTSTNNTATPVTPNPAGDGDDWMNTGTGGNKKKKGKKGR